MSTAIETYIVFTVITSHLCLFLDLSPIQKNPMCKLNYLFALLLSAILPSILTTFIDYSSTTLKVAVGLSVALICSALITLFIQKVINIDVDF